jgi:Holliday junction resolvasome RuvABC DNA-binding subunit
VIKFRKKKKNIKTTESDKVEETSKIDVALLSKCCTILSSYGYEKSEIEPLIVKTYENSPTTDIKTLVKNTLMKIGDIHG